MKSLKISTFAVVFTLVATAGVQSNWALEGIDFHDHDNEEAEEAQKCVEFEGVRDPFIGGLWLSAGNRCGKRIMVFVCVKKEFLEVPPSYDEASDSPSEAKYCGKHIDLPSLSDHPRLNAGDIIQSAFMNSSYYNRFMVIEPYARAKEAARNGERYTNGVSMLKRDVVNVATCFYPKAPYAPLESFPDGSYYCVDKDKLVFDAGYHPYYFFRDDFERWNKDYLKNEGEFQKKWQEIFEKSCPPNLYRRNPVLPCYG